MITTTDVLAARARGLRTLVSLRGENAMWSDFDIGMAGPSDHWVTAFVCEALSDDTDAITDSIDALQRRQRSDGGWGYNERIVSDADTTALSVLSLFKQAGHFDLAGAEAFLWSHRVESPTGFSTYNDPSALTAMYQLQTKRELSNFSGWCGAHTEVTAAVVEALSSISTKHAPDLQFISDTFCESFDSLTLWTGYWSIDWFYATYRVGRCLEDARGRYSTILSRMRTTITTHQGRLGEWRAPATGRGCAFRTALAMELLLPEASKYSSELQAGIQWLLDKQEGCLWKTDSEFLRVPPPHVSRPDEYKGWGQNGSGRGAQFLDQAGVLTSAVVLRTLGMYANSVRLS